MKNRLLGIDSNLFGCWNLAWVGFVDDTEGIMSQTPAHRALTPEQIACDDRKRISAETGIPADDLQRMEIEVQEGKVSPGFAASVRWLFRKYPKTLKKLAE